ncbi:MAG: protein TolQ [Pelagibacteraceae bacterium]|jgi:biopolymer transport protein TolQ|nr:protein TolQ [Pelagibacteraceae bacterium]OUV88260.1 MAG: protein TolQ [Pelagibacteraceae bacterium TMED146]|tara:strand:- start:4239 stop:4916 length:678 start_codon:yes stop_codon:yes gene_type:complete
MEPQVGAAASAIAAADFSFWTLFTRADFIVKSVIIMLIAASIYSWALIFEKYKVFKKIFKSSEEFEEEFLNSKSVKTLFEKTSSDTDDPMTVVFRSGANYLMQYKSQSQAVLTEKVKRVMDVAIDKEVEKYENKLTFLATVGSVAPFIGLFGTVWGIMNSFQSIAISRNTSLAIVAPGIAEALFATALGLLAAIPAVVAYNKFTSSSRKFTQKLENFTQTFLSII